MPGEVVMYVPSKLGRCVVGREDVLREGEEADDDVCMMEVV